MNAVYISVHVCMCIISILDSVHEFKKASKFNTFKNVVSDYIYVRMNLYHVNIILSFFFYTLQFAGHNGNEKTLYKKERGDSRAINRKFLIRLHTGIHLPCLIFIYNSFVFPSFLKFSSHFIFAPIVLRQYQDWASNRPKSCSDSSTAKHSAIGVSVMGLQR